MVLPLTTFYKLSRDGDRLTVWNYENISVLPLEVLGDVIMTMKHFSHLHIVPDYDDCNHGQLEILRDQVNELILPLRPNFKFDIFRIGSKFENEFVRIVCCTSKE